MKRITTAALATALLAGVTSAQIYIPSNTPTTGGCNFYPMGQTEARYQTIIDASLLPNAPFKITDLAFAPCNTAGVSIRQFQVRMCHTTLSDFSSATGFDKNLSPCPTELYNGALRWSGTTDTWSPLRLHCDFGYDGRRNILVEVRLSGATNGTSCRRDSATPRLWAVGPGTYAATSGTGDLAALKMELIYDKTCVMLAPDTVSLGNSLPITVENAPAGVNFQVAASLGQRPFKAGNYLVCLTVDSVFFSSLVVGAPVFNGYAGTTNRTGQYGAKFVPPALRSLVGLCVYHAGVAYDRTGILCATNTVGSQIVP